MVVRLVEEAEADFARDGLTNSAGNTVRVTDAGGELHRDAEPPSGAGGEGEGSVVCLGDAFDDCQAEADAWVVGAYAFSAATKRLGKRGN
jgi:hypothetical protein